MTGWKGCASRVRESVPPERIAFALRRMRREQYRVEPDTDGTDGVRLALLMRASAAGRRSAAEHVVAWLAEQGLRLDVEDPVTALADSPEGATMLATLEAVIDYWGEPRRAAQALGVHPNTVRYRTARLADWCDIDLDDPAQRLAVRLEIARIRATGR